MKRKKIEDPNARRFMDGSIIEISKKKTTEKEKRKSKQKSKT